SPDLVPNPNSEISASRVPTVQTTVFRDQPVLSLIAEKVTSRIEIIDVKPATSKDPKNKIPITGPRPSGAWEIISGNATNANPIADVTTSPIWTPAACVIKHRVEKTPIPAKISKPELENATTHPEDVRLVRRFR